MTLSNEAFAYDSWADWYDLAMGDRNPYIIFYSGLLTSTTRLVIELGCGTGIVIDALARELHTLTDAKDIRFLGLDGSREMLRIARQRNNRINWVLCDLRTFDVDAPFDLVISCYNTLQHVDSAGLAEAFSSIRSALRPGGLFAFDIYQPNLAYLRQPQHNRLAWEFIDESGRRLEIREDSFYDIASKLLTLDWRVAPEGGNTTTPLARAHFRMWQHFPEDIDRLLSDAGFSICARYGDLQKSPFHLSSKKQIVVCRALDSSKEGPTCESPRI